MKPETYTLLAYAIYLAAITTTTLIVTRMIFRHGRVFITQGFGGDEALAGSTGSMLHTQFILTALAAMLLMLRFSDGADSLLLPARPLDAAQLFEALSVKLGVMLLVIGAMHFLTLRKINGIRGNGSIF